MKIDVIVTAVEISTLQNGDMKLTLTAPRNQRHLIEPISELTKLSNDTKEQLFQATIGKYRRKRSLDANSYFHLLVGKIANSMNLGADETKVKMVLEYGTVARDEFGDKVGIKLPASVKVNSIYSYAKWFDERIEKGKAFNCYIIYKQTRDLDRSEMAILINGVIEEAKALGIETRTPQQIAEMLKQIKE